MITKNFSGESFDDFLSKLTDSLQKEDFSLVEVRDVIHSPLPLPKIVVLTVQKNRTPFRISVVYDKNGITVTVVGLRDENLKSEITGILDSLQ
ncbi:hypothetical protein [Persephonella sp.]